MLLLTLLQTGVKCFSPIAKAIQLGQTMSYKHIRFPYVVQLRLRHFTLVNSGKVLRSLALHITRNSNESSNVERLLKGISKMGKKAKIIVKTCRIFFKIIYARTEVHVV